MRLFGIVSPFHPCLGNKTIVRLCRDLGTKSWNAAIPDQVKKLPLFGMHDITMRYGHGLARFAQTKPHEAQLSIGLQ